MAKLKLCMLEHKAGVQKRGMSLIEGHSLFDKMYFFDPRKTLGTKNVDENVSWKHKNGQLERAIADLYRLF